MKKIEKFNNKCKAIYGELPKNPKEKLKKFLKELSKIYPQKVLVQNKREDKKINNELIKDGIPKKENGLKWESTTDILNYIDSCQNGIDELITYVRKTEEIGNTYISILESIKKDFKELYEKNYDSNDIDEIQDKFSNNIVKIIKDGFVENIIESIYKCLSSEKYKEFLERINIFLRKCGFKEKKIFVGDKIDTRITSIAHPEYTENSELHKMIKEIIWPSYYMKYYSNEKNKYIKKLIKGKVICYTNKKK